MGDMTKQLIRLTPEAQRGDNNLIKFLEAAGEFLDRTKKAIEATDHIKDYELVGIAHLSERLDERGVELPNALPVDFRRQYLRDVADHNAKHGTDSALRYSLDTIGLKGDIRKAWLLSPDLIADGKYKDAMTGNVIDFPIDKKLGSSFRTSMVYGDPVIGVDGTFLKGHTYDDDLFQNPVNYHIVGESYLNTINPAQK